MHPPHVLQIFVRNRSRQGVTNQEIAATLRKRLKWHELDPEAMTDAGRERYRLVDEMLRELEEGDSH